MSTSESHIPLYDAFGERYDVMVDWKERLAREAPFLEQVARATDARRALDVGCGTGWHAAHFARHGLAAVGVDPSAEMVRLAREQHSGTPNLSFVQAGLGGLRRSLEGRFDLAVCLGNTLPHVADSAALAAALVDLREVLTPSGTLVVQQLNYDRILAEGRRFLGTTSRTMGETEYLFFRFYDFHSSHLTFNLITFSRRAGPRELGADDWSFSADSTRLLPIRSGELRAALDAAGFASVRLLGGYDGSQFDPAASGDLIVVAERAGV